MTLKTRWSSSVSCSAISRAERFSKGSAFPPSACGHTAWHPVKMVINHLQHLSTAWLHHVNDEDYKHVSETHQPYHLFQADLIVTWIFLSQSSGTQWKGTGNVVSHTLNRTSKCLKDPHHVIWISTHWCINTMDTSWWSVHIDVSILWIPDND